MSAAQQSREQRIAAAHGAPCHQAPAVGVVGDQTLVPLVLVPGNVAFVVIADQHVPLRAVAAEAARDALTSVLDGHAALRPAKRVRAGVDGVGHQLVDGAVDRRLPDNVALLANDPDSRQQHFLLPQPKVDLADAPELRELAEHEIDGLAHSPVGILGDPIAADLHVAYRHAEEELAARRLEPQRLECQWRSKKGPPRRCKKGPLGGCGLVPVVHGRAPRATGRALNRLRRRRAREGPVGPRGQAWAGWSVQLAVGV